MSFSQIQADLKKKNFQPIYFLHGSESYFIDAISDYIEQHALSEAEKAFNQTILYGKEIDHLQVIDAARRFPMMAPYQVVIIKEAQAMRNLKDLQTYIEKPSATTILVICHKHKRFNFNSKFGKSLKANALVFESKKLWDNEVPGWIKDYLRKKGMKVQPNAADLMAEYLGTDLSKVANELNKFEINLEKGTEITAEHVEKQIGISREYNIFELQKAIGRRDIQKSNQIIKYFISNPKKNPLVLIIGTLYNYFNKIYMLHFLRKESDNEIMSALKLRSAYVLKDYKGALRFYNYQKTTEVISLLKEFDLKSKGVDFNNTGKPEGELLKELVWKILH